MKKTLFTGLIILLPLALTMALFLFAIDILTTPFLNLFPSSLLSFAKIYLPKLPTNILLFGVRLSILFFLIFLTCLIGAVARKFFFRSVIECTHYLFYKIPFLRTVFKVATEVAKALFNRSEAEGKAFKHPVMVPFPSKKSGCIGFVSGSIPKECASKVDNLVPVFVPTSPHPISGYMMMIPKEDISNIDMTNEDAVKFTVSCGMIHTFVKKKPSL